MTMTTLANFEIFIDAVGIGCCAATLLYLIIRKRSDRRAAARQSSEFCGVFTKGDADSEAAKTSFSSVMASFKDELPTSSQNIRIEDPYDEVRRLLDLGMEPRQIAMKVKIPSCEIELVADLHRMQTRHEIDIVDNLASHATMA